MNLNEKLKHQDLSGLEALEYLRQLRGTSKSIPKSADPQVDLAFGRGHRVVGPSATLEELLAAPSESVLEKAPFHPGYEYVFKEPFEPSIELTKDGIIESGVYVRRALEPEPEAPRTAVSEINEQFPLQPEEKREVLESTGYGDPQSSTCYGNSIGSDSTPILEPTPVKSHKRPVGRPKVWSSETERMAAYRKRKQVESELLSPEGT